MNWPGVAYEELVYEGYGPAGCAVIIEVTTDNKNRSALLKSEKFLQFIMGIWAKLDVLLGCLIQLDL